MNRIVILLILLLSVVSSNSLNNNYISLTSYGSESKALNDKKVIEDRIMRDNIISKFKEKYKFEVVINERDNKFNVSLVGFTNNSVIPILYDFMKDNFSNISIYYNIPEKEISTNKFMDTLVVGSIFFLMLSLGGFFISRISKKKKILENKYKILNNSKLKLENEFDKVMHNLGYNIKKTDEVLTDTTSQIIDFLKAKSGKLELQEVKFDINRLLGAVTTMVSQKHKNKNKNVELIYDVSKDVPRYMLGDYDRLSKIIVNFVDNAVRNTQKGKVILSISIFKEDNDDVNIEYKVVDTGIGIKEDKMDTIFTPFQNGSSLLDTDNKGSIGLSMSRELVNLMKGKFYFKSKENKGSTFSIKIPLIIDEDSNEQAYQLSTQDLYSKNIGIIDSDNDVVWAMKNIFSHFHNSITIIPSYAVKDHDILYKCDIIYIDYKLVDTLMLELFKQIQSNKDFRVVVTSNILEDYAENINNQTVNRYVKKPFSPSRILKSFVDEYNSLKVVSNLEELLLMEEEESSNNDNLLKKYNEPMPETEGVDRDSLSEFFGSTILIVEDDKLNRKILEMMLDNTGIKYAISNDTDSTLEQLKKYYNHFDMILINIAVSNMSGYTIAKIIRYDKSFDNIPIVAMVEEEDKAVDLAEAGINGYFIKPLKMGILYTIFDRFLTKIDLESMDKLSVLSKSEHILDITRGIMLANNNQENYVLLLQEFVKAYGDSGEKFESLVINREYQKAKILAMDMKGLTSIIAANNMNMLIGEIEEINIGKEYKKLDNYIEKYSDEMDDLVTNIEIYIRSLNS
ncbi:Sensory box histidine kinase/response regulator [hydrothermal vent metagenome]|uniref:Sensory box histidine kinase/response regulator n=1 Tax=hydrothermal vent metagenome TaxID=652676 RepID=A0A1W1EJL1_9ZZZZ